VRAIGRWDLTAAVVNGVVGSAIFGLPATLVALTGAWSPAAALAAGLGILTVLLCFAEVGSRFAEAGGPYLYAREAFGPWVGFQIGWLTFWTRVLSAAANLNVFALYLGELVPGARDGAGRLASMAALWAVVTAINLAGVRQATWTIDAVTVAKLLPLGAIVALGLGRISGETLGTQLVERTDWTQAVLLLVFAYGGFEVALVPASEARDPRRDTAFALVVSLALVAALYFLIQLVVVGVVPHAAGERAPIAAVLGVLLGPAGATLASLGALVSIYGWTTGTLLQSPRLLFAMAERGELPAPLARVHARWRTPHVAILVFAAATIGLAALGSFASNATVAAIVRLVYYGLTAAALLVLRRRGGPPPGFRLPAAGLIAPLAMLFCLWLLSTRTFEQAWILAALVAAGAALHAVAARRGGAAAGTS
jgi:amino acid transporter